MKPVILVLIISAACVATNVQNATNTNSTGLWARVLQECSKNASVSCVQKNVLDYIGDEFRTDEVEVSDFLKFRKNGFVYVQEKKGARSSDDHDFMDDLNDRTNGFLLTHDVEVVLPDILEGEAIVNFSPRAMDGSGALISLKVKPKENKKEVVEPRIFFKKIKKFFSNKLWMAFLALMLIIKLISMKFMFLLPALMGVAAAKKLLLKAILFVFPFLSHLFKLCPYYAATKYHHHHHQIAHLHHVPHLPHLPHLEHGGGIELDHPPPGWHEGESAPHHHDFKTHEHQEGLGYYSDGPSFSADFVNHRKKLDLEVPVRRVEDNLVGYGEHGQGHNGVGHRGQELKPSRNKAGPLTPTEIENMILKAEKEAMLKGRLQEEQKRVEVENKRLQDRIKSAMKLQEKLKIQSMVAKQTSKIAAAYQPNMMQPTYLQPQLVHTMQPQGVHQGSQGMHQGVQGIHQGSQGMHQGNQGVHQGTQVIHQGTQGIHQGTPQGAVQGYFPHHVQQQTQAIFQPSIQVSQTSPSPIYHVATSQVSSEVYDAFYSPILDKIDKVLNELRFHEEPCRERLICSMYKNPVKFSPHSNLLSAELSRDEEELQKPLSSNPVVIRFYKYVQAARDGQDKRDCHRLYPTCAIATE